MATVAELSTPLSNVLITPRHGDDVCRTCFNLIDGHDRCYACAHGGELLDLVAPISYSIAGEQLHHTLTSYKRTRASWSRQLAGQLAAVVWRHLDGHETCLAAGARIESPSFALVTVVPSSRTDDLKPQPLQTIVGELTGPTRERYAPLLERTSDVVTAHEYSPDRFVATRPLDGEPVLVIDDTWTTGASAQGAAAALKRAGAGPVAALVIGRYLNRAYRDNDRRLSAMPGPFDWTQCCCCASVGPRLEPSAEGV